MGRSRDDLLGQIVGSVTHPDDAERDLALLRRLYATGEPFVVDTQYLRPDGAVAWALNSVTPLRDHDGTIVGGFAMSVDVTDRKRTEAALRESEARYRTLVEHFPNGSVFLFDHALRYTLAGGKHRRMMGALRQFP